MNILQRANGSFAWENILLLLILFAIGYLIRRGIDQRIIRKHTDSIRERDSRHKQLENEYKGYKTGHEASFRQHEKAVADMAQHVKALEGDIRALSDEKNKVVQEVHHQKEEVKNYSKLVSQREDTMKEMQEAHEKQLTEMSANVRAIKGELENARAWEPKVKAAEEEARKAKAALADLQKRTLEFDLRLKAASEYAARVQPLEQELASLKAKNEALGDELNAKTNASEAAVLELKDTTQKVRQSQEEIAELQARVAEKEARILSLTERTKAADEKADSLQAVHVELKIARETNATLQTEMAQLRVLLAEKEALVNRLEERTGSLRTLEEELRMSRDANAVLQRETGEKNSVIKRLQEELESRKEAVTAPPETRPPVAAINSGTSPITEETPGQGEES